MRWVAAIFSIAFFVSSVASLPLASSGLRKRGGIDQGTFNDLVFFLKYASSAYAASCPKPNGNTLIQTINDKATDTQGFIALDKSRKQIVVAMRGSTSPKDFQVDADIALVNFVSPGVNPPAGALVHEGFLTSWNAVAPTIIATVKSQLEANTNFSIATSGHSLGGALSSLAGISMQQNFPNTTVNMFTYGQPRTGNAAYATFVNQQLGDNVFRSVHTTDGVPTIIPQTAGGYQHHGVEFFQNPDPASAATTKACDPSGEDPSCSDSIPSGGINAAHLTYFNIPLGTRFCN